MCTERALLLLPRQLTLRLFLGMHVRNSLPASVETNRPSGDLP